MPSVLLYGFFERGNLGDDLMVGQVDAWCRGASIQTTKLSLPNPRFRGVHRFLLETRSADAAVLVGGTHFDARSSFGYLLAVLKHIALALLIRSRGTSVHLLGIGIDPPPMRLCKWALRSLLSVVSSVSVRDGESRSVVTNAGADDAVLVSDPAFAAPLPELGAVGGNVLLVCPTANSELGQFERLLSNTPLRIRIASIYCPCDSAGDRAAAAALFSKLTQLRPEHPTELVSYRGDPFDSQLWAGVGVVCSARYHVELLAVHSGLEVITVADAPKFRSLRVACGGEDQHEPWFNLKPGWAI